MMATSATSNPYPSHMLTPNINSDNVFNDRSFAERVFHILMTWGKKVTELMVPAASPSSLMKSNCV